MYKRTTLLLTSVSTTDNNRKQIVTIAPAYKTNLFYLIMKLQFRGKTYERPDLNLEVNEGEIGGMYRGKPWRTHQLKEKYRCSHVKSDLTYRGVHYTKD